jgi:hypothetical protein
MPTLSELLTARAILRQKRDNASTLTDYLALSDGVQNMTNAIMALPASPDVAYNISQDGIGSFILTHRSGYPRYAVCPCCDKPILSLAIAKALARNLTQYDALNTEPKDQMPC